MEHDAEVLEVLKASLTFDLTNGVATNYRVRMMFSETAFDDSGLAHMELNFTIVACLVHLRILKRSRGLSRRSTLAIILCSTWLVAKHPQNTIFVRIYGTL